MSNSIRDLADRLGCTHGALRKAALEGRLSAGVQVRGKRVLITDADAAADEWMQQHADSAIELPSGIPPLKVSRARREAALAELAERELAVHKGQYVEVETARHDLTSIYSILRTQLLALPSKLAQHLPRDVHRQVVPLVERLVYATLNESADAIARRFESDNEYDDDDQQQEKER